MHREVPPPHAPQQFKHRHVAERLVETAAAEQETVLVIATCTDLLEDFQCPIGQGHAMVLAGLHALGWHGPEVVLPVYFRKLGADGFAGPRRGEDGELKRPRGNAFLLTQLYQERWQFGIGQRTVMLDLAHFCPRWQQLVEMAAPARRIFALAIATHRGPVEH